VLASSTYIAKSNQSIGWHRLIKLPLHLL